MPPNPSPLKSLLIDSLHAIGLGSRPLYTVSVLLLSLTACSSQTSETSLQHETLKVRLQADSSYNWRVRALTSQQAGQWSESFLLQPTIGDLNQFNVSYAPEQELSAEQFTNLLFSDDTQQILSDGGGDFIGVPVFTWSNDAAAEAYEIEILDATSRKRVGIYQYAQSSICINSTCELTLENTGNTLVDLPPIPIIEQTVLEATAPYAATLSSPVLGKGDAGTIDHTWSIEGQYTGFSDDPTFRHTFTEAGNYTINVVVANAEGMTEYAQTTIRVSDPDVASTEGVNTVSVFDVVRNQRLVNASVDEAAPAAGIDSGTVSEESTVSVDSVVAPDTADTADTADIIDNANPVDADLTTDGADIDPIVAAALPDETASEEPLDNRLDNALTAPVVTVVALEQSPVSTSQDSTDVELVGAESDSVVDEKSPDIQNVEETGDGLVTASVDSSDIVVPVEAATTPDVSGQELIAPEPIAVATDTSAEQPATIGTQTDNVDQSSPVQIVETPSLNEVVEVDPAVEQAVLPAADVVQISEAFKLDFDDDLQLGGVFYGMPGSGFKTANAPIALQSSRRFMAERTGDIVAVRHNNRTLNADNISGRCLPSDPDSVWCKCKNAGLDEYTCGYTLSNSYSVGNGGSIVVEIRPDDGTEDHAPTEEVLGQSAKPYVPMDVGSEYPEIELSSPVRLEAGKLYHIVYKNINPPSGCDIRGVSIGDAASCPKDQGAIGLNGVSHRVDVGPTARFGPYLGSSPAVLYRNSSSQSWRTSPTVVSWYEVKYDNGLWVGDSVVAYDAHRGGDKTIQGDAKGRQVFTVHDSVRHVDGLWLNHGHTPSANGKPLLVELKDAEGNVLASGSIPASEECRTMVSNTDDYFESKCRAWGYADFSNVVDLLPGSSYTVELSAAAGADFHVSTYFSLKHYGSTDRNSWNDAHAEFSTDGGSQWSPWISSFTERDIPMLFTIEGQPRQIR